MRRFAVFAALLLASSTVPLAQASAPASGVVRPPSSGFGRGPALTWGGATYDAAFNQSAEWMPDCAENPCDRFTVSVSVPSNYWKTRRGGLTVRIDGFDRNQDFDLYVGGMPQYRSTRPVGQVDDLFIPFARGRYTIVVVPYQAVRTSYRGTAFLSVQSVRPQSMKATPGIANTRVTPARQQHYRPSIAVNPRNSKHMIAATLDSSRMVFSPSMPWIGYTTDGGRTWRPAASIPHQSGHDIWVMNPASVQFDRNGTAYMLTSVWAIDFLAFSWSAWAQTSVRVLRSSDGGRTWTVAGDAISVQGEGGRVVQNWQPWFALDTTKPGVDASPGTMVACWLQSTGSPGVSSYDVEGLRWSVPVDLPYPAYAAPPRGRTTQLVAAASVDGGKTWTAPRVLAGGGSVLSGALVAPPSSESIRTLSLQSGAEAPTACRVATGPAGEVSVVWIDATTMDIRIASAPAGGLAFLPPVTIASVAGVRHMLDGGIPNVTSGSVAYSPDGTINVVWADGRNVGYDVQIARSRDRGMTWSAPARVSNDRYRGGFDQFAPQIAVTPAGQLNVFFYDRRNDRGNYYIDAYLARSTDAVRWRNTRLSTLLTDPVPSAPDYYGDGVPGWLGDVQSIVAENAAAQAFWTDRRAGVWQVWSARVPNTGAYR